MHADLGDGVFWLGAISLALGMVSLPLLGSLVPTSFWPEYPFWTNVITSSVAALFGIPIVTIFTSYIVRRSTGTAERNRLISTLLAEIGIVDEAVRAAAPNCDGNVAEEVSRLDQYLEELPTNEVPHEDIEVERRVTVQQAHYLRIYIEGDTEASEYVRKVFPTSDHAVARAHEAADAWRRALARERDALVLALQPFPHTARTKLDRSLAKLPNRPVWHRLLNDGEWARVLRWYEDPDSVPLKQTDVHNIAHYTYSVYHIREYAQALLEVAEAVREIRERLAAERN